ncbi:MAG: hypothetical protein Q7K35_01130 [bacterium]|nr:hypothetical protein [bacterium]
MNESKIEQGSANSDNEQAMVAKFERMGIKNVVSVFRVENEKSLDGKEIKAEIFWVKFKKPEGQEFSDLSEVEGKIYLPVEPSGELILFTPGFPGGNAGRFEQLYAEDFTDAGYAFFTVRHNGTSLTNGATSLEILNSAKRMEIAQKQGEHHIGGTRPEGYSPFDIINESITPLMALQNKYEKIHLMGQSMGVAASYNAIRRTQGHPEVQNKIGNVVGISGYVGKEHEGATWDTMNMPMADLTEYEYGYVKKVDANIVPKEQFQAEMAKVAEANKALKIPGHIGNVLVYTPKDPLVAGPDKSKKDYALNYGPVSAKKIIIEDETNLADKKPHSMLWISPENLLRAVKAKVSSHGPHFVKVPRAKDGLIERG